MPILSEHIVVATVRRKRPLFYEKRPISIKRDPPKRPWLYEETYKRDSCYTHRDLHHSTEDHTFLTTSKETLVLRKGTYITHKRPTKETLIIRRDLQKKILLYWKGLILLNRGSHFPYHVERDPCFTKTNPCHSKETTDMAHEQRRQKEACINQKETHKNAIWPTNYHTRAHELIRRTK